MPAKITNDTHAMFVSLSALPPTVVKKTYDYFVSITPKRSGNARRSTKLENNTIDADYAYAERLDQGYSKQAPRGMSDPSIAKMIEFAEQEINNLK